MSHVSTSDMTIILLKLPFVNTDELIEPLVRADDDNYDDDDDDDSYTDTQIMHHL